MFMLLPFTVRLIFLWVLITILALPAHALDLEEIQAAIRAKGAKWVAADSPLARLSLEEKKRRVGAIGPKPLRALPPTAPRLLAVPAGFDWRHQPGGNYVTPVKDQGECNACWAFAPTAALESRALITFNRPGYNLDLSEQIVISCSGAGNTIFGGSIAKASAFLMQYGTEMESCYPFGGWDGYCDLACEGWTGRTYEFTKVMMHESYPGGSVEIIKQEVYLYGPAVVGLYVAEDFFSYHSGTFSHVAGEAIGTHALVVVGWDDSRGAFICKNSFGPLWGEGGYIYMAYGECKSDTELGFQTISYEDVRYPSATMARNPQSLINVCFQGSNAKPQSFEIWGETGKVCYDLATDADWLSCTPVKGVSTGEHDTITVNYATGGLEVGDHQGCITISGQPGITAYTLKIPVTLKVVPKLPPRPVPLDLLLLRR